MAQTLTAQDVEKRAAARAAAEQVRNGDLVGLGTGSTVAFMLERLAERVAAEGIVIRGVCTSQATESRAAALGIPTELLSAGRRIDIYIDGADQIDGDGRMIKGGGGALLREKMVARWSRRRLIMVDASKPVARLGGSFPLPVEIVQFGSETVMQQLRALGCEPVIRHKAGSVFISDEGHLIADCDFRDGIADPVALEAALRSIAGVVETGLFIGLCDQLFVAKGEHVTTQTFTRKEPHA